MSIPSQLNRINNNVQSALETIAATGVSVGSNSDALPAAAAALANKKQDKYYGVCSTAAETVAKTVQIDGFKLVEGARVTIKFTNANSIASPTLNVSGTGAYPMYRYGTTTLSTGTTTTGWVAGAIQVFTFDGTGWIRDYWNNTTYSNASLGQGYATCSTAAATTAKTASLSSYALTTGGIVAVKFTHDVPANATLNINSKGAKAIYHRGAKITAGVIKAGDIATFIYSSYYHLISIDRPQAEKSTTATATLSASSWSNGSYTLSVTGVTTTSNQEILPALNITAEQLEALQGANIQDGGQTTGSITLKAFGAVPTINIPIRIIVRGDA